MSELETAKFILTYMVEDIQPVLEKAIEMIPIDKLDFKPKENLNSIKWLAYHALNSPFYYLKGVEQTILTQTLFDSFKIDLKDINDLKILVNYSSRLKSFINAIEKKINEEDIKKIVTFEVWEPWWSQTGFEAIRTALEEMIHHRGQMCTYLRFIDLNPPLLYPYL